MGDPDGNGIVKDGTHDGLISGNQCFGCEAPVRPSLGFYDGKNHQSRVGGPRGEVGVQSDTQDFRGSVKQGHRVTDSHLMEELGLVGVRVEQSHSRFLGSNLTKL